MSDWGWVALAVAIVYGTLAAYAVLLGRRLRAARKALDGR